jgi:hypothetical protein
VASGGADKTVRVHDWRAFAAAAADSAQSGSSSSSGASGTNGDGAGSSGGGPPSRSACLACPAPPLCLEWQPAASAAGRAPLLAVACMDGAVALAQLRGQSPDPRQKSRNCRDKDNHCDGEGDASAAAAAARPLSLQWVFEAGAGAGGGHGKHVNALQWSPDGTFLCSAGADRTVKLWRVGPAAAPSAAGAAAAEDAAVAEDAAEELKADANANEEAVVCAACLWCVKTWRMDAAVEALCFLPHASLARPATGGSIRKGGVGSGGTLVLAPRGHHSLVYVDLATLAEFEVGGLFYLARVVVRCEEKGVRE